MRITINRLEMYIRQLGFWLLDQGRRGKQKGGRWPSFFCILGLVVSLGIFFIVSDRNHDADIQILFCVAAAFIFSVVVWLAFHSVAIVVDAVVAAVQAGVSTLLNNHFLHLELPISSVHCYLMVYVLTLFPIIFITVIWRQFQEEDRGAEIFDFTFEAVRKSFAASFWMMILGVMGFTALFFLPEAASLKQLGFAGIFGTWNAFAMAYFVFPWFLPHGNNPNY